MTIRYYVVFIRYYLSKSNSCAFLASMTSLFMFDRELKSPPWPLHVPVEVQFRDWRYSKWES